MMLERSNVTCFCASRVLSQFRVPKIVCRRRFIAMLVLKTQAQPIAEPAWHSD